MKSSSERGKERILRKIYGTKLLDGQWRIRTKEELYQLYKKKTLIITAIKSKRLRWFGHVERMPEDRVAKKVWQERQEGHRKSGRWMDKIEKDLRMLGVKNWKRKASDKKE